MNQIGKVLRSMKSVRGSVVVTLVTFCIISVGMVARGTDVVYAERINHIISHSATFIAQGETVADLVVIGNDVHVDGAVTDILIVINGNAYLASGAHVESLIDIGGQVRREPGAKVNNIFTLTFNHPLLNSTVIGGALIAFLAGLQLTVSAAIVLVPMLLSILLKPWMQTSIFYLEKSARRMGSIGLFATVTAIAVAVALSATLVGIPIAALVGLMYLSIGAVGLANVSVFIGKTLLDAFTKQKHTWMQSLLGATLLMAFANIPFIGVLIFACMWIIGVGTVTTWLWHLRGRNKR